MVSLFSNFDPFNTLIYVIVLLTTIPLHEYAHAAMAVRLGDPGPANQGRMTLNPAAHLDPWGSVAMLLFGFGWGRPVRVNPSRFRRPKLGMTLTALAGPMAHVLLALFFILLSKPVLAYLPAYRHTAALPVLARALQRLVEVNLFLALFNLLPIPPLDGGDILAGFLPPEANRFLHNRQYALGIVLLVLLMFGLIQWPLSYAVEWMITGLEWLTSPLNALFR